jgi:RimJ/RimL family protein N-acetyltransferase
MQPHLIEMEDDQFPIYERLFLPLMLEDDGYTAEEWPHYKNKNRMRAWFLMEPNESSDPIGWCCTAEKSDMPPHIGLYGGVVLPPYRQRGYAAFMMQERLQKYQGHSFVAHVQPENIASMNLVLKLGFRPHAFKKPWISFLRPA